MGRFFLFLCFLEGDALAYVRIVLRKFELTIYLLLVLAGVVDVVRLRRLQLDKVVLRHIDGLYQKA